MSEEAIRAFDVRYNGTQSTSSPAAVSIVGVKSLLDRYGIDSCHVIPPWLPSINPECRHNLGYDCIIFEFPRLSHIPAFWTSSLCSNSAGKRNGTNVSNSGHADAPAFHWSVSIWVTSNVRLSSNLILPLDLSDTDDSSSVAADTIYAFSLSNIKHDAINLFHLVIELIHTTTSIPVAQSIVHLQIDSDDPSVANVTTDPKAAEEAKVYDKNTKLSQKLAYLQSAKADAASRLAYTTDAMIITIGKCTTIPVELKSLSPILDIVPKDVKYPLMTIVCGIQPSLTASCHWAVNESYRLEVFPAYTPSAFDVMSSFTCNVAAKEDNVTSSTQSPYQQQSVDTRIYVSALDLQLCPDLLHMCSNSAIVLSAQGYTGETIYSSSDSVLNSKSSFLGAVVHNKGEWASLVEVRSCYSSCEPIDRIKLNVSLIYYNEDDGSIDQQLLCTGEILGTNSSRSDGKSNDVSEAFDVFPSGEQKVMLTVQRRLYSEVVVAEVIGCMIVSVHVAGTGVYDPLIGSNKLLTDTYNERLMYYLNPNVYSDVDMHHIDTRFSTIDALACLANCTLKLVKVMASPLTTNINADRDKVMKNIEVLLSCLTTSELCNHYTINMVCSLLQQQYMFPAKLAMHLWLVHWIESQKFLKYHPSTLINHAVDVVHSERYDIFTSGHILMSKEWMSLRCACSCLMFLSKSSSSSGDITLTAEFMSLKGHTLDNSSIHGLCDSFLEHILSHAQQSVTLAVGTYRSMPSTTAVYPHSYIDDVVSRSIECASMLLCGAKQLSINLSSVVSSFISASLASSSAILSAVSKHDNSCCHSKTVNAKKKSFDYTSNQTNSLLLLFLSMLMKSQPRDLQTLYSQPFWGTAGTSSKSIGRDLQSYSPADSIATVVSEHLSSCITAIADFVVSASVLYPSHLRPSQYCNRYSVHRCLLLLHTSCKSMTMVIFTGLSATLQTYDECTSIDASCTRGLKSGEAALKFVMERATFLESFLNCCKVATALLGLNICSSSSSSGDGAVDATNVMLMVQSRQLLDMIMNSIMKGYECDASMVSLVLRTFSYSSGTYASNDNGLGFHVLMLLVYAIASVQQFWLFVEQLVQYQSSANAGNASMSTSDPTRGMCGITAIPYLSFTLSYTCLYKLLQHDYVLLKEAASNLFIRATTDPLLSIDNVKAYMRRQKKKARTKSNKFGQSESLTKGSYTLFSVMTAEDSLEAGPVSQWIRLWQQLIVSLTDLIKSLSLLMLHETRRNNSTDNSDDSSEEVGIPDFVTMLCEICLLYPLLDGTSMSTECDRPDLVLLCLEDEAHSVVVLKSLLSTAASLPTQAAKYRRCRKMLVSCCFDLMKLLSDSPVSSLGLETQVLGLIDDMILATLPKTVRQSGMEYGLVDVCPAVYEILSSAVTDGTSLEHSLLMDGRYLSQRGYALTLQTLYSLLCTRASQDKKQRLRGVDGTSEPDTSPFFVFLEVVTRKLTSIRLYVSAKMHCFLPLSMSHDISDANFHCTFNTEADVTNRLVYRYSLLVATAALQSFLPSVDVPTHSQGVKKVSSIATELVSLCHLMYGAHFDQSKPLPMRLVVGVMDAQSAALLSNHDKASRQRQLNQLTGFCIDPVRQHGFGFLATLELLHLYLHDKAIDVFNIQTLELETSHQHVRSAFGYYLAQGDWDVCFRLIATRRDTYTHWLKCTANTIVESSRSSSYIDDVYHTVIDDNGDEEVEDRYQYLLSELDRATDKLLEHGQQDSSYRPCPLFYAVKFSASPWDITDAAAAADFVNFQHFYAATGCVSADAIVGTYLTGTWFIIRCDPTAFAASGDMYNEYVKSESSHLYSSSIRSPVFMPPQSFLAVEKSLRAAFPDYHLISPTEHYDVGKNPDYRAMQLFQAVPEGLQQSNAADYWENMLHCRRFHVYTFDSQNQQSLLRYSVSTERCDDEWYSDPVPSSAGSSLSDMETSNPDSVFNLFALSHWVSPLSVSYVTRTDTITVCSGLLDVLNYQTLLCEPLLNALEYLDSLPEQTIQLQPDKEISSRLSIMIATATTAYNILSSVAGIPVGFFNAFEVIGAEVDRRRAGWLELRCVVKQDHVKALKAYEEMCGYKILDMRRQLAYDGVYATSAASAAYQEKQMLNSLPPPPMEPPYAQLEQQYYQDMAPLKDLQEQHDLIIAKVENTVLMMRSCINSMHKYTSSITAATAESKGQILLLLQLVLWLESMVVTVDFKSNML